MFTEPRGAAFLDNDGAGSWLPINTSSSVKGTRKSRKWTATMKKAARNLTIRGSSGAAGSRGSKKHSVVKPENDTSNYLAEQPDVQVPRNDMSPVAPMDWEEAMAESMHDFSSVVGTDKVATSNPLFADDVDGTEDTVTSAFGKSTPARSNPLFHDA
jgi:hypothetical protein